MIDRASGQGGRRGGVLRSAVPGLRRRCELERERKTRGMEGLPNVLTHSPDLRFRFFLCVLRIFEKLL